MYEVEVCYASYYIFYKPPLNNNMNHFSIILRTFHVCPWHFTKPLWTSIAILNFEPKLKWNKKTDLSHWKSTNHHLKLPIFPTRTLSVTTHSVSVTSAFCHHTKLYSFILPSVFVYFAAHAYFLSNDTLQCRSSCAVFPINTRADFRVVVCTAKSLLTSQLHSHQASLCVI